MKLTLNQVKVAQIALNTIYEFAERMNVTSTYLDNSVIVKLGNDFVCADWTKKDGHDDAYIEVRKIIIENHLGRFTNRFDGDLSIGELLSDFQSTLNLLIEIAKSINFSGFSCYATNVEFKNMNISFENYLFSSDSEFEIVSLSSSLADN